MMITSTLRACALCLFSLGACTSSNNNVDINDRSNFISVDSANKMLQSYIDSKPPNDSSQLISLIVDADDLRFYLSDTSIIGLKLMLAHPLEYINSGNEGVNGGLQSDALTVVFAGFDSNGNYVLKPDNKVPNKAQRCPPFCIISGTASNNLIE